MSLFFWCRRQILVLLLGCVVNSFSFENEYTFSGDYTYSEVLNALSLKSGRSVLGSTDCLDKKRAWSIYKKDFSVSVEHIKKNLKSDGYFLYIDTSCFYVYRDTSVVKPSDTSRVVFLPFSRRYLITSDKEKFLNARHDDSVFFYKDSFSLKSLPFYVYKCDLYVSGRTGDSSYNSGFQANELLSAAYVIGGLYPKVSLSLNYQNRFKGDELNFFRHLVFFLRGDTSQTLLFGSEVRRPVTQITTVTGAVSTSYESVYGGMTIVVSPVWYKLIYRLGDNQLSITGVPDSVSFGQSVFNDVQKIRNFLFFKYKGSSIQSFSLSSLLRVSVVDSFFISK